MPSRKNRPDKFKGLPKTAVRTPKEAVDFWLLHNPGHTARRIPGPVPAWELSSANFTVFGGFFATVSWDDTQERWALTHNMIPSQGDFAYHHRTIADAVSWYRER